MAAKLTWQAAAAKLVIGQRGTVGSERSAASELGWRVGSVPWGPVDMMFPGPVQVPRTGMCKGSDGRYKCLLAGAFARAGSHIKLACATATRPICSAWELLAGPIILRPNLLACRCATPKRQAPAEARPYARLPGASRFARAGTHIICATAPGPEASSLLTGARFPS